MSSAKIKIWDTTVGYLYWDDPNQTALFESDESYIDSKLNIAPLLHDQKEKNLTGSDYPIPFKGMIPTFNDSLPDSFGNTVFKEWLEQMNMDQSQMNPVERLLYIGKRGIGALEYQKGKKIGNTIEHIDLNELAAISNKIIERKYAQEDFRHDPQALKNILTIGSSVGGAQAKILLAETKDGRFLAGDVLHKEHVEYYIVKLQLNPSNIWQKEKNYIEFIYNEIARDIGINVAQSKLIYEDDRPHFASKRFDRIENRKVHKQTVNALTGFWGRNVEFGYNHIFKIIDFLRLPYKNTEQLYKQMVFNVALSNRDDHTKNFSFLMNEQGEWSLSPAYDLTFPRDPYTNFNTVHQIHVNKKNKNIMRKDVESVAKLAGVRNYNHIIDSVLDQASTFSKRIKDYPLESNTTKLILKEINQNMRRLSK